MMTEAMRGKTIVEIESLFKTFHELVTGVCGPEDHEEELGKLLVFGGVRDFPVRVKCATLAWHTMLAALELKREDGVDRMSEGAGMNDEQVDAATEATTTEGTGNPLKDLVIAALKTCYDPEIPVDIWELGLIYGVDIVGRRTTSLRSEMTLTSPACPGRRIAPWRGRGPGSRGRGCHRRQGRTRVGSAVDAGSDVRGGQGRARTSSSRTRPGGDPPGWYPTRAYRGKIGSCCFACFRLHRAGNRVVVARLPSPVAPAFAQSPGVLGEAVRKPPKKQYFALAIGFQRWDNLADFDVGELAPNVAEDRRVRPHRALNVELSYHHRLAGNVRRAWLVRRRLRCVLL